MKYDEGVDDDCGSAAERARQRIEEDQAEDVSADVEWPGTNTIKLILQ